MCNSGTLYVAQSYDISGQPYFELNFLNLELGAYAVHKILEINLSSESIVCFTLKFQVKLLNIQDLTFNQLYIYYVSICLIKTTLDSLQKTGIIYNNIFMIYYA